MITDAIATPGPGRLPRRRRRARVNAGVDVAALHRRRGAQRGRLPRSSLRAARRGELSAQALQQSYDRVLALKGWLNEPAAVRAKRQAKARRQARRGASQPHAASTS